MDGAWWSMAIPFALIPIYGVALGALALSRKRSQRVTDKSANFWSNELAFTTCVLAAPGLVAAAWGIYILAGLILLPLGVAVVVIATRVAGG
jgi:uncharacterized membrane protein SirB2